MAKKTPIVAAKLMPEQIHRVESAVFTRVLEHLPAPFFLVGVTLEKFAGTWTLQIFIDRPERNVSLDDCQHVSRLLDPLLEDELPGAPEFKDLSYNLEVSSPGLFRPLSTVREFEFYQGQPVAVQVLQGSGKKTPEYVNREEGCLAGYDAQSNAVLIHQQDGQLEPRRVPLGEQTRVVLNPTIHLPLEDVTGPGP